MQHRIFCLVLAGLLGGYGCSHALAADLRSMKHPLYGYWESNIAETGCTESYWFKEDGNAVFTSGQELVEARYEVSSQPDAYGFFKLEHRITLSNKAEDCTKQISEVNTQKTSYLLFQPDGTSFIACDTVDDSLESCFGSMQLKNNTSKRVQ